MSDPTNTHCTDPTCTDADCLRWGGLFDLESRWLRITEALTRAYRQGVLTMGQRADIGAAAQHAYNSVSADIDRMSRSS